MDPTTAALIAPTINSAMTAASSSSGSFFGGNGFASLGSGFGDIMSAVGGFSAQSSSKSENKRNRRLQLHMFNRAMEEYKKRYQTAVADLKAAGLNPLLAVTGGGSMAGSPPSGGSAGSSVSPVNVFSGLGQIAHSAVELKKLTNEAKLIDAQTKKINQDVVASQASISQDKIRLDNEIKTLKLRQDELENKKLDSASERKKRDAEISTLKDQLSTAEYQRGLLQQQINEMDAKYNRSRYGDGLGIATSVVSDAFSGYSDISNSMYNFASSAMQKFDLKKRLNEEISREIQHWKNIGQNYQRLYHRVRSSPIFKSNRRNTMYRSSYFPHQSDFR